MKKQEFQVPVELAECGAKVAIVLGSGLGVLSKEFSLLARIPYCEVSGLPVSRVPGHAGEFLVVDWEGEPVILASGRVHLYEGWSAVEASAGVRLLAGIGVQTLLLTNAAGSVDKGLLPGSWMMLSDHLNLQGDSPLAGSARFLDQSEPYSKRLREIFHQAALELGIDLREGVYAALRGPEYETPAEVRMLGILGANAVGMSTVPETIQARALGLEVAAFSCMTNFGAGLFEGVVSHEDVTATGARAASVMVSLLRAAFPNILEASE